MTTSDLTSSTQSYDASPATLGSQADASGDFPIYVSFRRPLPSITIGLHPLNRDCSSAGVTHAIKNYPLVPPARALSADSASSA